MYNFSGDILPNLGRKHLMIFAGFVFIYFRSLVGTFVSPSPRAVRRRLWVRTAYVAQRARKAPVPTDEQSFLRVHVG